jgi:histone H3/H4
MELPLAPIKRMLEKTGLRVGKKAAEEFAILLEEIITDIAAEATAIAKQNGRKTILASDVKAAKKKLIA